MSAERFEFSQAIGSVAKRNGPVVVLESTVIAHGLPRPDNLETALEMEAVVRECGALPATIAILDGVVRIGLSPAEIEHLARSADSQSHTGSLKTGPLETASPGQFPKANRRDLSVLLAHHGTAATTVSATLWLAIRSGLGPCVMATGGLGGVHLGAADSFDISTDLDALARADGSIVVCSGFKSILDVAASLEALETRGVAVVGYRTRDFPAFTTVSSGLSLEHRVESPEEAALLARTHRELGLPGAIVLANPAPVAEAVDRDLMDSALEAAFQAARRNVSGKGITPFLLEAVRRATGGKSLRSNRALLVANARLAAEVAVALHPQVDLREDSGRGL
jgi:pseudouridine-5'-phosphate glycosidase